MLSLISCKDSFIIYIRCVDKAAQFPGH